MPKRSQAIHPLALLLASPALLLAAVLHPGALAGQVFTTDDAGIADPSACQLEAWAGEAESWILPACQFVPNLEITAGALFTDFGAGSRDLAGILEGKYQLRSPDEEEWGWAVVLGAALPTASELARPAEVFGYVPVTWAPEACPLILHLNLGWSMARFPEPQGTDSEHFLVWGARSDVEFTSRLGGTAELFGLGGEETQFHVGLWSEVVPGRLVLFVSHGFHLDSGEDGLGFQAGFAWTPAPFR